MNYKILIIKSGAVIVDLPENPKYEDISAVFADKAKQIRFKDENDVNLKLLLAMLLGDGDFLKVGQTFDLPDNLGVSFESCKMCEGTGQYEKPYQQFIKCNYCSNGKLAILTPITEDTEPEDITIKPVYTSETKLRVAPVKSEGEEKMYTKSEVLDILSRGMEKVNVYHTGYMNAKIYGKYMRAYAEEWFDKNVN